MQYAIAHGYDWIYILDADSAPAPDAIEKVASLLPKPEPAASGHDMVARQPAERGGFAHHASVFTPHGIEMVDPPPEPSHYRCNTNMWSGSLYRLDAVKDVGLPDANYVLDYGDVIYGYEGMIRAYTALPSKPASSGTSSSPVDTLQRRRFGRRLVEVYYAAPIRCYYSWRNSIYFWTYKYKGETVLAWDWPTFTGS